jgi:hypothetical protein
MFGSGGLRFSAARSFCRLSSSDYLLQIIWQGEQRVIDRKGSAGKVGFGLWEEGLVDFLLVSDCGLPEGSGMRFLT